MSAAIAMGFLVVTIAPVAGDGPGTPSEQFRALKRGYDAAFEEFARAAAEVKTAADDAKLAKLPGRNPRGFAGGFMALAGKYPGTEAAEDALVWVGSHVLFGPETEKAKRLLLRDHVRSARLAKVFAFQWFTCGSAATERLLRGAMAANPHREVRGLATYWLARFLIEQAQWSREARRAREKASPAATGSMIPPAPIVVEGWGADYVDRVRGLDPQSLEREAESLFARVVDAYADLPNNDKNRRQGTGTLGDAARAQLHELRRLAVGKPAPEIEGRDLDGRPFRLGDYRGKVVVLDFGSHFY